MAIGEEDQECEGEGIRDGKSSEPEPKPASAAAVMCRKDRRKALKKEKRKQKRKEAAEKEREEEEAWINDPEEQRRIQLEEEREKERLERERREFEEKERLFLEALARRKAQEEEKEQKRRAMMEEAQQLNENQEIEANEDDEWEYREEGPPEIIWQGNEIIVKKNRVRVKKKDADQQDSDRPASNPLLPQSEAFANFKNTSLISAQQLLENVAQQIPNFGTEQDKAHCPFHLKTGTCRFGTRCSRVHFYPDRSCTLLIKNMYNGPGLAWEQDEGLECTDEEVECSYEVFYEDVHTEFLKFGEIVNFKVCRNVSSHLRGNVYVHYVSLDAAILAYNAINGRYFAGKQVSCEFISVTRWKVAICGEYMKSKLKTCSHGMACNFIHCFRNPAGDYKWADWDKPPPKYWQKKMAALFGYSNESGHEKWIEQDSPGRHGNSSERLTTNAERHHSRRSHSKEVKYSSRSRRDYPEKDESRCYKYRKRDTSHETTRPEVFDEGERNSSSHHGKKRRYDSPSDRDWHDRKHNGRLESHDSRETKRSRSHDTVSDADVSDREIKTEKHHEHEYPKKRSRKQKALTGSVDDCDYSKERHYSTGSSRDSSYGKRGSLSSKDHLYQKKRRSHASDSTEEDSSDRIPESRNERRRKSRKHRNEVSGYEGAGRSLHDKHCEGEGKHGDHNLQAGQKRSSSGKKREHSGRKKSEVDKC